MTRKEGIKLHREMWRWLADNPWAEKLDWPRWERNGGDIDIIISLCFACEIIGRDNCTNDKCVFVWRVRHCEEMNSEYNKWRRAKQDRWRTYWAKKIAELPLRKKTLDK
jgi:hypothetical protein